VRGFGWDVYNYMGHGNIAVLRGRYGPFLSVYHIHYNIGGHDHDLGLINIYN